MSTVVILGFHRSGTSLLTRVLHKAGLFVGDDLLAAGESNRYGHFEDKEVVEFHDRILAQAGRTWMFDGDASELGVNERDMLWLRRFVGRRNSLHKLWGFKDPRTCLFLSHWSGAVENAKYIMVFRDFMETCQSILNRQSLDILNEKGGRSNHLAFWRDPGLATRMWISYNAPLVRFAVSQPESVLCIRHRELLNGYPLVPKVNQKFGFELDITLDKSLVDHGATTIELGPLLGLDDPQLDEASRLWHEVEELTNGRDYVLADRLDLVRQMSSATKAARDLVVDDGAVSSLLVEFNRLRAQLCDPRNGRSGKGGPKESPAQSKQNSGADRQITNRAQ